MSTSIVIISTINCCLVLSCILAINPDRIPSCQSQQTTYDSCVRAKLLSNGINMHSIQSVCTERCFPLPTTTTPIPTTTAYQMCVHNAIDKCLNTQSNGIRLQPKREPQDAWDLRQMPFYSADCQACIQSIVGQTMHVDTMAAAQCLAYDECNPGADSTPAIDTCTSESRQLYTAECVCKRDHLAQIIQTCHQANIDGEFRDQEYEMNNTRLCRGGDNYQPTSPVLRQSCSGDESVAVIYIVPVTIVESQN